MDRKSKRNNDYLKAFWSRSDMVASRRRMKWATYIFVVAVIVIKALELSHLAPRPVPAVMEHRLIMPPQVFRAPPPPPHVPRFVPVAPSTSRFTYPLLPGSAPVVQSPSLPPRLLRRIKALRARALVKNRDGN